MKITVTYTMVTESNDADEMGGVLEGRDFDGLDVDDQDVLDCMQNAADELEDEGITVDQGGDDDTYDLFLADAFDSREEAIEVAQRLLDLAEENLNELERERS